jgi:hypothetical protein
MISRVSIFLSLACLLLGACDSAMITSNSAKVGTSQSDTQQIKEINNTKDIPQADLGIITSSAKASRAWREFIKDGRYRLASPDDFSFPNASRKEMYRPYSIGDFNGDQQYQDFAVIVIDTSRNDDQRFGIVIFNEQEGGTGYDGPFWLYRESDLSRVSLTITSHGPLLVAKHNEDDPVKLCVVSWEQDQREYKCSENPAP